MTDRPHVRELRCAPPGLAASNVRIGQGVAAELATAIANREACWIVDPAATDRFEPNTRGHLRLDIPGGEASKSFATLEHVLRAMTQRGLTRNSCVVALGGGSIGDLAGVAASLYLRGVALIQVPTTLLSMIDSSVGGKTAINLPEGKNLVGTFWPAETVLIDPAFLQTLPDAEYRSGLGEALKIAIGLDADLFELLEQNQPAILDRDQNLLAQIVEHCIATKIRIVEQDPKEAGPRRLLNLGHTMGHAYEAWSHRTRSKHTIPHGVAVAHGIHTALELAQQHDLIAPKDANRAHQLLDHYGFSQDQRPEAPATELTQYLRRDKKVANDHLNWVLPTGIGTSQVHPLPLP